MLRQLDFHAVGPAPEMRIAFTTRLNLIAGDNGLGKSFLLDTAWWALTRTWARRLVVQNCRFERLLGFEPLLGRAVCFDMG